MGCIVVYEGGTRAPVDCFSILLFFHHKLALVAAPAFRNVNATLMKMTRGFHHKVCQ